MNPEIGHQPLKRAVKARKKASPHQRLLQALNLCSGILFAIGAYGLLDPQSLMDWLKVVLIGIAGGLAAYAINSTAITRGCYQAAIGIHGAAITSLLALVLVGTTISLASYAGLTVNSVDQMRLAAFARENSLYTQKRIAAARQADQVLAALESAQAQTRVAAACEAESSCVSRHRNGGEGIAFHTLNSVAQQIDTVQQKMDSGAAAYDAALQQVEASDAGIKAAVQATYASRYARRAAIEKHHATQHRALDALDRAYPLALAVGLAQTLDRGVAIPGQAVLSQRINERLRPAASGIKQALAAAQAVAQPAPSMPRETGVLDTLGWVAHFLPQFLILVLIDALFPLLLWVHSYWALRQHVEPEANPDKDDPFALDSVIKTPPISMAGSKAAGARRAKSPGRPAKPGS